MASRSRALTAPDAEACFAKLIVRSDAGDHRCATRRLSTPGVATLAKPAIDTLMPSFYALCKILRQVARQELSSHQLAAMCWAAGRCRRVARHLYSGTYLWFRSLSRKLNCDSLLSNPAGRTLWHLVSKSQKLCNMAHGID